MKQRKRKLRIAIGLTSFVLALSVAEVFLRTRAHDGFFVWEPSSERIFHPLPHLVPGVSDASRFVTNSLGLRGDELPPRADVRILAVGGSTTECSLLDQSEAWPQLVQSILNEEGDTLHWVGNAGSSGRHTRDHTVQLKYLLPQLPRIDVVVALLGVNDLLLRLGEDEAYDPEFLGRADAEEYELPRAFRVLPLEYEVRDRVWKRTALWRFGRKVRDRISPSPLVVHGAGTAFETWRGHRQEAARIRTELPDLSSALAEYRRNVETIIDQCRARDIRVVLATQPYIWREDLSPELEARLWMGGMGHYQEEPGAEYYAPEALARGMELYNEVLRDVSREHEVELVDLAPLIPRDGDSFYDDVHFTEAGSALVGRAIAAQLERGAPR